MRDLRLIVVSIAMRLLTRRVLALGGSGVVRVLPVLVVVVVPVLCLLAWGRIWMLAVAVIVMTSLRMSGHLGE
jgi:hypothetical protein